MFHGTYKFENFYFNCCIEATHVNLSPFYCFKLYTHWCALLRTTPPPMWTWAWWILGKATQNWVFNGTKNESL